MITGVLYYDSNSIPLSEKVAAAARVYERRCGGKPDTCYVHPTALPDGDRVFDGIAVKPCSRVLKHHLWLGIERENDGEKRPVPAEDAHPGRPSQAALFDVDRPAVAAAS